MATVIRPAVIRLRRRTRGSVVFLRQDRHMIHCITKSGALGFEWVLNRSNSSAGPAPAYLHRWIVGSRKGCRGDATMPPAPQATCVRSVCALWKCIGMSSIGTDFAHVRAAGAAHRVWSATDKRLRDQRWRGLGVKRSSSSNVYEWRTSYIFGFGSVGSGQVTMKRYSCDE